jgi:S1-C subfamily serine protease
LVQRVAAERGTQRESRLTSTLDSVSWIDGVIVIVVIVATYRGLRLGIFRQLGALAGFVTGFVIGVVVAPPLAGQIDVVPLRQLFAFFIVTAFVVGFSILGRLAGGAANTSMRRLHLGRVDQVGGAIFAALGALVACWLVAGILATVPQGGIGMAIGQSRLLAVLDSVMPPVPTVESRVQSLFRSADFPSVFNEVVSPTTADYPVPNLSAVPSAGNTVRSIAKIEAVDGCGIDREGTGFVVAPGIFVTAAHVVSGANRIVVNEHVARVVLLDPNNDVAVLVGDTKGLPAIALAAVPRADTLATIAGFPLNGLLASTGAAIDGQLTARGPDIYDQATVTRLLVALSAAVEPGNSGSPVLVDHRAVAMVFSKSTAQADVAYAVPASIIANELRGLSTHSKTVSSGGCPAT